MINFTNVSNAPKIAFKYLKTSVPFQSTGIDRAYFYVKLDNEIAVQNSASEVQIKYNAFRISSYGGELVYINPETMVIPIGVDVNIKYNKEP